MSILDLERDLRAHLRAQRASLLEQLSTWTGGDSGSPEATDGQVLIDALADGDEDALLPYFEAAAQRLAEQGVPLEPRMGSVHRSAEALAHGLSHVLADNPVARAAGHERLAAVMREVDLALVRGYHSVATRRLMETATWAQQGLARVQALRRINAAANSTLDLSETLQTTVRAVAEVLRADLCSIFLYDETTRELQLERWMS